MTEANLIETTQETMLETQVSEPALPMEGEKSMASNILVFVMVVGIFAMLYMNIKYTRRKK